MAEATGSIRITLHDGSRRPVGPDVVWIATIYNGHPSSQKIYHINGTGPVKLIGGLAFFNNVYDHYTVEVSAEGYIQTRWTHVVISPERVATVNLMLLPEGARFDFSPAAWTALPQTHPMLHNFLRNGAKDDVDAETRYNTIMEKDPASLACLLNIFTTMSAIRLPDNKTPLDFYWQVIWDDQYPFAMARDHFYAYVDRNLVQAIHEAAHVSDFVKDPCPYIITPGATSSYRQDRFGVPNLRLTFHESKSTTRSIAVVKA